MLHSVSQTKRNLIVDLTIAAIFLVVMEPGATGLALHEWIGVGLGAGFFTHMLLHWKWVVATSARLFGRLAAQQRLNYILNVALLLTFTLVIGSGLMISQVVADFVGLQAMRSGFWEWLHFTLADVSVFLVGLHIALHWKWILNALGRYIWQPTRSLLRPRSAAPQLNPTQIEL